MKGCLDFTTEVNTLPPTRETNFSAQVAATRRSSGTALRSTQALHEVCQKRRVATVLQIDGHGTFRSSHAFRRLAPAIIGRRLVHPRAYSLRARANHIAICQRPRTTICSLQCDTTCQQTLQVCVHSETVSLHDLRVLTNALRDAGAFHERSAYDFGNQPIQDPTESK